MVYVYMVYVLLYDKVPISVQQYDSPDVTTVFHAPPNCEVVPFLRYVHMLNIFSSY